ncbi:polymorphic toxin-type HINT domain-containing protein [Planctomyces sp. SH-PL14]|uniref:polymorphic toxin-type HINT domain-containing protein n=1 Tax=Planctomyces sp. SH-PL14 TaxID=1632864 RepID=UPI00078D1C22|nr:polymorphic toxin-type HINT domain-containing protein [Planctomyces sp. SH-PL14]AMV19773.1 hypothetical protein VT03_17885 [Planctomyces sp. SH-PL14]
MLRILGNLSLVCGVLATGAAVLAAPPTPKSSAPSAEESPVVDGKRILELELSGDQAARASAVTRRLAENPNDPLAQWAAGNVKVGDTWVPFAEVADHGDRWKELYDYRKARDSRQMTVEDQLFLADGSRAHRLKDEERAHLTAVTLLDPTHTEARQRLGDMQVQGRWVAREAIGRAIHHQERWSTSLNRYGKQATALVRRLRNKSSEVVARNLQQFDEWTAPEKLPALESAIGDAGDPLHTAYVEWLGTVSHFQASHALVRQALFSENANIRLQATEELKDRPTEGYLRELISSVTLMSENPTPEVLAGRGAQTVRFTMETLDQKIDLQLLLKNPIERLTVLMAPDVPGFLDFNETVGKAGAQIWASILVNQTAGDGVRNRRAIQTVAAVAGQKLQQPADVWKWWETEGDAVGGKQLVSMNYEQTWYIDPRTRRIEHAPRQIVRQKTCPPGSCLAAGTMIVTELGARPVESIQPGDRVLSQNVETGELTFKPVFAQTVREKAKLYRVKTGDNEILCSHGHPFWINGEGWVQARSLQPKMPLHTVRGAVEVTSVEPAGEGTVHNLVVADSHTYFVGKEGSFLSHDVTPRQATNALIPGLQPVWDLGAEKDAEKPLTAR